MFYFQYFLLDVHAYMWKKNTWFSLVDGYLLEDLQIHRVLEWIQLIRRVKDKRKYIKLRKCTFLLLELRSLYSYFISAVTIFPQVTTILFCCMLSYQQIPLLRKLIFNKSFHSETWKIPFLPNDLRLFIKTSSQTTPM